MIKDKDIKFINITKMIFNIYVGPATWNKLFGSNPVAKTTKRTFNGVLVEFHPRKVNISNSNTLLNYLGQSGHGARTMSSSITAYYRDFYNISLSISIDSMTVEILCHVYPQTLAGLIVGGSLALPSSIRPAALTLINKLVGHTYNIDSGESSVDTNRGIFNDLAPYRGAFEAVLSD